MKRDGNYLENEGRKGGNGAWVCFQWGHLCGHRLSGKGGHEPDEYQAGGNHKKSEKTGVAFRFWPTDQSLA